MPNHCGIIGYTKNAVKNFVAPLVVEGQTQLHIAARDGNVAEVRSLLSRGFNINARTKVWMTPLHYATIGGFVDLVEILLKYGAYVDAAELHHGYTALHYAAELGFPRIGALLITMGHANVNLRDKDHWTPLHLCLRPLKPSTLNSDNHRALASTLIKNRAYLNVRTIKGYTALHFAAFSNYMAIVLELVHAGAYVNPITNNGMSPLQLAYLKYNENIAEYLRDEITRVIGVPSF